MNPPDKKTINGTEYEGWNRPLGFLAVIKNSTKMFYDGLTPMSMNPPYDESKLDNEGKKAAKANR